MAAQYRERTREMSRRIETWQLRAQFAAALSRMYGAEVPAYTTLVDVSTEVNRDTRAGSARERVTAERHGAIRVGQPARTRRRRRPVRGVRHVPGRATTICARPRPPVPVVSTAFRPIDADELERNPFRVFTSMLATADTRFFAPDLRGRVERFLPRVGCSIPR